MKEVGREFVHQFSFQKELKSMIDQYLDNPNSGNYGNHSGDNPNSGNYGNHSGNYGGRKNFNNSNPEHSGSQVSQELGDTPGEDVAFCLDNGTKARLFGVLSLSLNIAFAINPQRSRHVICPLDNVHAATHPKSICPMGKLQSAETYLLRSTTMQKDKDRKNGDYRKDQPLVVTGDYRNLDRLKDTPMEDTALNVNMEDDNDERRLLSLDRFDCYNRAQRFSYDPSDRLFMVAWHARQKTTQTFLQDVTVIPDPLPLLLMLPTIRRRKQNRLVFEVISKKKSSRCSRTRRRRSLNLEENLEENSDEEYHNAKADPKLLFQVESTQCADVIESLRPKLITLIDQMIGIPATHWDISVKKAFGKLVSMLGDSYELYAGERNPERFAPVFDKNDPRYSYYCNSISSRGSTSSSFLKNLTEVRNHRSPQAVEFLYSHFTEEERKERSLRGAKDLLSSNTNHNATNTVTTGLNTANVIHHNANNKDVQIQSDEKQKTKKPQSELQKFLLADDEDENNTSSEEFENESSNESEESENESSNESEESENETSSNESEESESVFRSKKRRRLDSADKNDKKRHSSISDKKKSSPKKSSPKRNNKLKAAAVALRQKSNVPASQKNQKNPLLKRTSPPKKDKSDEVRHFEVNVPASCGDCVRVPVYRTPTGNVVPVTRPPRKEIPPDILAILKGSSSLLPPLGKEKEKSSSSVGTTKKNAECFSALGEKSDSVNQKPSDSALGEKSDNVNQKPSDSGLGEKSDNVNQKPSDSGLGEKSDNVNQKPSAPSNVIPPKFPATPFPEIPEVVSSIPEVGASGTDNVAAQQPNSGTDIVVAQQPDSGTDNVAAQQKEQRVNTETRPVGEEHVVQSVVVNPTANVSAMEEPNPTANVSAMEEPNPTANVSAMEEPNPTANVSAMEEPNPTATVSAMEEPNPTANVSAMEEPNPTANVSAMEEPNPTANVSAMEEPNPTGNVVEDLKKNSGSVENNEPVVTISAENNEPVVTNSEASIGEEAKSERTSPTQVAAVAALEAELERRIQMGGGLTRSDLTDLFVENPMKVDKETAREILTRLRREGKLRVS